MKMFHVEMKIIYKILKRTFVKIKLITKRKTKNKEKKGTEKIGAA